jgi:hypothetical protein
MVDLSKFDLRNKLNFNFKIKPKHKQKIINTCYFSAVGIAFVLSLAHNNRVEASIDNQNYFSYLIVEDNINQNAEENDCVSSLPLLGSRFF